MGRTFVALLASLPWLGTAAAQEVRGTVRESVSRQPIPGAVVTLLDDGGRALGRNITDERGRYRVGVSAATTQLRFIRIGFRPATVQLTRKGAAVDTVDVAMTILPTMLEPMTVRANACPRRDDAGKAIGLLEQARASLLNSIVAREANPGSFVRLRFHRTMDGTSDRIAHQSVKIDSAARSEAPFISARTGSEFVRDGFVRDDADGSVYFAPDADALLDDAFIAGYCFGLVRGDRNHRTEVGLRFSAATRARARVDIDGVLWVDTTQRQLRRLEFRYVGLDRSLDPAKPGGQLSFRDMANGVVVIDRWSLRLPVVRRDSTPAGYSPECVGNACFQTYSFRTRVDAQEIGGEVAHIAWPTGTAWDAALGTLRLAALTHSQGPAPGTMVKLDDTDYSGQADANGNLTLTRLLPGPYKLVIVDTLLRAIGVTIPTPVAFTAERDSTHQATIEATTVRDYVADRCRHDGVWKDMRSDGVWMIGRVVGPDGSSIERAQAGVSEGSSAKRARDESARLALIDSDKEVWSRPTGTDGIFTMCQSRFVVGDSIIVDLYQQGSMTNTFPFTLEDSLTVLPLVKAPRRP